MSGSKPGDTLRCCFSTTRDLLYVLLPREVSLNFGIVRCTSMAAIWAVGQVPRQLVDTHLQSMLQ